jgi:natural product biosynthesis luciferase-like monooxygenase protein/amino acid adenylation domain-containing protein
MITKAIIPQKIIEYFEKRTEETPNKVAVRIGEKEVTYKELNRRSNIIARKLRGKGVSNNIIVGIKVDRSIEMMIGILGILKAGGAYLPISPKEPIERIKYIFNDSQAKLLLVKTKEKELEAQTSIEQVIVNGEALIDGENTENLEVSRSMRDLAYVIYTSGSTGHPKGVMIEHGSLSNRLEWMQKEYQLKENDVILQKTSYTFDVSIWEILWWMMAGASVALLGPEEEKEPTKILNSIEKYKVTVLHFVPSMLNGFLHYMDGKKETKEHRSLRYVFSSGEALQVPQVENFYTNFDGTSAKLINLYGPTEATIDVSSFECKPNTKYETIPIGKPIANTEMFILNEEKQVQPVGVMGELWIAGSGLARGYINRPDLTKERFVPHLFKDGEKMYRTGDLAKWLPDGNIEYVGRIDDQVKVRGYRIELGEIEAQLVKIEEIREAVVTAREDEEGQKYLCGYVVLDEEKLSAVKIKEKLSSRLPSYMVPTFIVFLDEMPLTISGKVDKKALPNPYDSLHENIEEMVEPRTETEEKVLSIWKEVLKVENIGVNSNFFELGGHSLKAMTLNTIIQKEFSTDISLKQLFLNPTIKMLAEVLEKENIARVDPIMKVEKNKKIPLTYAQQGIFLESNMEENSTNYNLVSAIEIQGKVDIQKLEEGFKLLIDRHEILRTKFLLVEGEPTQTVEPEVGFQLLLKESNAKDIDYEISSLIRPFNLNEAPLIRATLVKFGYEHYVLVIESHHIVFDGTSQEIFIEELFRYYQDRTLPSLEISYKDYAAWEKREHRDRVISSQENFWIESMKDFQPLDLPTDFPRSNHFDSEGEQYKFSIDGETLNELKSFTKKHDITLFMLLTAAYNIFLSKYSNQEDIVVGIPMSGRNQEELSSIIGMFVNTLPLRNYPMSNKSIHAFLQEVKESIILTFDNQEYPLSLLVNKMNIERVQGKNPLFDTMFVMQNMEKFDLDSVNELNLSRYPVNQKISNYDLTLIAQEEENSLSFEVEYRKGLFNAKTIEKMMKHFVRLVQQVVENSGKNIGEISVHSHEEEQLILEEFNQTQTKYPTPLEGVVELFEKRVKQTPNKVALIFEDESLTYKELNERANQVAHSLLKRGLKTEEPVGVLMNRTMDLITSIWGVLKAGGVYVPIDPNYPAERIHFILNDSNTQLLITHRNLNREVQFDGKVLDVSETIAEETDNLSAKPHLSSLVYIIYTSGSTGVPKGVLTTHNNLLNFCFGMNDQLLPEENGRILATTSVSFDPSILELVWSVTQGLTIILSPDNSEQYDNLDRFLPSSDNRSVDFSLFFFSSYDNEIENGKYDLLLKSTQYADEQGFKATWIPERHFHEFGGLYPNPSVVASALSMVTNQIELRSGSIVSPLQSPLRIAEEWSVVDNLSNGRVGLSFASGWIADDFILSPNNYSNRKEIMFKQIEEVRDLWKGKKLEYVNGVGKKVTKGTFPRPLQKDVPIWVTSSGSKATFKKAGEIGANVLTHLLGQDIDDLKENIKIYKETLTQNGFSADEGKVTLMVHTFIGEDIDLVKEKVKEPFCEYLRTSTGLIHTLAKSLGMNLEKDNVSEMNELIEIGFERFWQTSALLGTPSSCSELVKKLASIGVDEIACLIDFGVEQDDVLNSLKYVNQVKDSFTQKREEALLTRHKEDGISYLQVTPSRLKILLNDPQSQEFLKRVETFLIGGEELPISMVEKLQEKSKGRILNVYGPTETTVWSSVYQINPGCKRMLIGKPINNRQFYILDKDQNVVPVGVPGEIYISGDGVAKGYNNQNDLTKKCFMKNFINQKSSYVYRTGDLGRYLPDGNIEFLGRKDNQVKVRGFRIELREVEEAILKDPRVKEIVVLAKEDARGDRVLIGYVVGEDTLTLNELRKIAKRFLPDYMIPSGFVQLERLPLTSNGKVNKSLLPDPSNSFDIGMNYVAPTNPTEQKIVDIWEDILGVSGVGIEDNFFELGGHSLAAMTLASKVNKAFDIKLPLKVIFENKTIRELSMYINKMDREILEEIPQVEEKEYYLASSGQRRMYAVNQSVESLLGYNETNVFALGGEVNPEILEKSINEIVDRHEILRTTFIVKDKELVQYVHKSHHVELECFEANDDSEVERIIQDFIRPFDFEKLSLFRVGLINSGRKQIFILDIHHIIADGGSVNIFLRELSELYKRKKLSPLRLQYKDYSEWHNKLLKTDKLRSQEEYWIKKMNGELPTLELPTDFPRPPIYSYEGKRMEFKLGKELTDQIKALALETDSTPYMVLLAAYNVFLYKYTGQEDIIVGTAVSGRSHGDLNKLMGMIVNTLPLRNFPRGSLTFKEFIKEVKKECLNAFSNQDYPFERLVDKLKIERDRSRNPLFSTMFLLQNKDAGLGSLEGVSFKPYKYNHQIAKCDLSLIASEEEEELVCTFEYSTKLFKDVTVEIFSRKLKWLFKEIIQNNEHNIEFLLKSLNNIESFEINEDSPIYSNSIHNYIENVNKGMDRRWNGLEKVVISAFEECLDRENLSITDNFFQLGGNSFLAVKMEIDLKEEINKKFSSFNTDMINYDMIYKLQTVEKIANFIIEEQKFKKQEIGVEMH